MRRKTSIVFALCLVSIAGWEYAPRSAHAGMIAHWSFDGCTTTDAGPGARHLTPGGGPTCVAGPFGEGWQLDGNTQYLERHSDPAFTPGHRAWSVVAWFKSTDTSVAGGALVTWYRCGANPNCGSDDPDYYQLYVSAGRVAFDMKDNAAQLATVRDVVTDVADGQWHLAVGTLNATRDSLKLYVDGVLRKVTACSLGPLNGADVPIGIGRVFITGWGVPTGYFEGSVDEVRIYDQELSAGMVAGLYNGNGTVDVGRKASGALSITSVAPNPMRGSTLQLGFTLPRAGDARLDVLDVAGRRVTTRGLEGLESGTHAVTLSPDGVLPPGVYRVRLVQGGRSVERAIVVLH